MRVGRLGIHSLKNFSEPFMLEPLTRVSAVITDENDTGTFVDDAAALKSVITGDPFQLNRKHKAPRNVLFRGFMIQCVNELPKLRDKSESMYRRLLVIPFDKRFQGCERKYIKDDYLNRQDVLEYVLYRVLAETDYYELAEPDACSALLDDFRVANDPYASSPTRFSLRRLGICSRASSCTTCTDIGSSAISLPVACSAETLSMNQSRALPRNRAGSCRSVFEAPGVWIFPSR